MANQCKYYKVVRQVSYDSGVTWVNIGETRKGDLYEYDSAECGAVTQYRWVDVTGQYTCDGTTKHQKTKKQYSTDGTTWQDVSPAEYGKGNVIEYYSEDCGGGEYSDQYLTFVALEGVRFKFWSNVDNVDGVNRVSYSLDGGSNWVSLPNNTYTPMVQSGQKIMWKGTFRHELFPNDGNAHNYMNNFGCTGRYKVEGNIMSLLYGDDFIGKTSLADTYRVFDNLFDGWFPDSGSLVNAENLILPATTLGESCYAAMFWNCTSLTTAPALPATTLAPYCYETMFNGTSISTMPDLPATTLVKGCYDNMFYNCTSLTTVYALPSTALEENCYDNMFAKCTSLATVPSNMLPATTLKKFCYFNMFQGCTSLRNAPDLPATTLVKGCYQVMFDGCSSLNYVKCLATDISATVCTSEWLKNVSSTGTFVKNSSMNDWTRGENGIPTNWTVQNA